MTDKIQQRLRDLYSGLRDDLDLQFNFQSQLDRSKEETEHSIEAAKKLRAELGLALEGLGKQTADLQKWMSENESNASSDPETFLVPLDAASEQLNRLRAENVAIDETL